MQKLMGMIGVFIFAITTMIITSPCEIALPTLFGKTVMFVNPFCKIETFAILHSDEMRLKQHLLKAQHSQRKQIKRQHPKQNQQLLNQVFVRQSNQQARKQL